MPILRNLVIATAGTLPHDTTHIKKWIEANGGIYTPTPNQNTTHLLASSDAYKKPHPAVQRASDLGIWIVSFDWFDDSLQAKRKLSEKKYTWESLRREKRKSREIKKLGVLADGKKFRDGCEGVRRLTGSGTLKGSGGAGGKGVSSGQKKKKKKSKSFFFGEEVAGLDAPFVSAGEDLERRRAERERERVRQKDKSLYTCPSTSLSSGPPLSSTSCSPSNPHSRPQPHAPEPSTIPPTTQNPPHATTQAKTPWKDLYHYYLDGTGFEYKITLMRSELGINSFARYVVGLLESHAKPHTYCVNVQYTPPAAKRAEGGGTTSESSNDSSNTNNNNSLPTPDTTPSSSPSSAEQARLTLLSQPPTPSPNHPYKTLLTPHHTSYLIAFRAFRHTFTDLTLLPWETRFSRDFKAAQAARAQALNIEPYAYKKPTPGLPMGLMPQVGGSGELGGGGGGGCRNDIDTDTDITYTRNAYNLPGITEPLTARGVIGAQVLRAAAARAERAMDEQERQGSGEVGAEDARKGGALQNRGMAMGTREQWRKPFFNGVTGRPGAGGVKKRKEERLFPSQRAYEG